jgi:hypothetical protein
LVYLTTILCNFKRENGAAFAYFSVVIKNYFIAATKKQAKRLKHEISYEEIMEGENSSDLDSTIDETNELYEETRDRDEFWNFLLYKVDSWDDLKLRKQKKFL